MLDIDTILTATQDAYTIENKIKYLTKGKKYKVLWTRDEDIQVTSDRGKAWLDTDPKSELYWGKYFTKPQVMIRIHINKGRAKQPYSVSYYSRKKIGKGKFELLARTENLPTRANCLTNIRSMASIFAAPDSGFVTAVDNTGKESKEILVNL